MVTIKANQAAAFLARPDPRIKALLLYGPDAGLVSERAQELARRLAAREQPAGEIIRLDDSDLEGDPDRLGTELLTMPMFGGAKIVRTSTGRRITAATLQPFVESGDMAGALIVEAGNLRPDDKLRATFEKSATAAAIGCYPDEGASLDRLVSEIVAAAELDITPEARQELIARLGADRALSRAEVEKLTIYAHGARRIELAHVEAIVGDASSTAIDHVVSAAAGGDADRALAECDRAVAGGDSPQSVILAAERHFHRLHRLRVGLEAGRPLDDLIRAMRPPLPPKARSELEREARAWTSDRVNAAMARITEAVRQSRTTGANEAVVAERLLMEIARLAKAGAAARRPT
jgi:DNA polymerase-3 subunit delta